MHLRGIWLRRPCSLCSLVSLLSFSLEPLPLASLSLVQITETQRGFHVLRSIGSLSVYCSTIWWQALINKRLRRNKSEQGHLIIGVGVVVVVVYSHHLSLTSKISRPDTRLIALDFAMCLAYPIPLKAFLLSSLPYVYLYLEYCRLTYNLQLYDYEFIPKDTRFIWISIWRGKSNQKSIHTRLLSLDFEETLRPVLWNYVQHLEGFGCPRFLVIDGCTVFLITEDQHRILG